MGRGEETDHQRGADDSLRVFLRERNDWRVCLAYGGDVSLESQRFKLGRIPETVR